ncbi:hypothetical protein MSAS_56070 [Mycobacterium saskatchewanense]|nr:hypothetical protein MSAS_56070 [Mycobacterium saskatchewanense]
MMLQRLRAILLMLLPVVLLGGIAAASGAASHPNRTTVVAYFDNSNGIFPGDDVMILGVPVGKILRIEPQPQRAKVTFWVDAKYPVPAEAKAVILLPQLITARAIQLTPAYTGGPVLRSGALIPQERTAVPVEWDDLRSQLQKLADALQPTEPGGVSPLGALINTAADNLRGQGSRIHDMVIELSQTLSALGDHSGDLFSTMKNLSMLVSGLHDSAELLRALNTNLASVTQVLANDHDEVGQAIDSLNTASEKVRTFVADNRDALGTTADKLSGISQALVASLDDIKQTLHVAPTAFQNFLNIYEPAHASLTGALALNNFANPITEPSRRFRRLPILGGSGLWDVSASTPTSFVNVRCAWSLRCARSTRRSGRRSRRSRACWGSAHRRRCGPGSAARRSIPASDRV